MNKLQALKKRIQDIKVLQQAAMNQSWYQQTLMPKGGYAAVELFYSSFQNLRHEKISSPAYAQLLATFVQPQTGSILDATLPKEERRMLRLAHQEWQRETAMTPAYVAEFSKLQSALFQAWKNARQKGDFESYPPLLASMFRLLKTKAKAIDPHRHPYEVLLHDYVPGIRLEQLETVFDELKAKTKVVMQSIAQSGKEAKRLPMPLKAFATQKHPGWIQEEVMTTLGFDLQRGSLHFAEHPFCIGVHPDDVKIALRPESENPIKAILSACHETGHGIYEQNLQKGPAFGMPAASPASYGIHESQARLYQCCVGSSLEYWEYMLPRLQAAFPEQLPGVVPEDVFAHLHGIAPGPIRLQADELTYSLHLVIRFEVEKEILTLPDEEIHIENIRSLWNTKVRENLGITVDEKNDFQGFMQDVHWFNGVVGYFPAYLIGNLAASQLFETLKESVPDTMQRIAQGDFLFIRDFLKEKIHQYGNTMDSIPLIEKATGKKFGCDAFMQRMAENVSRVYGIQAPEMQQSLMHHSPAHHRLLPPSQRSGEGGKGAPRCRGKSL